MNKTQATIDTINTLAPHLANDVHEFFRTREKSTTAPADYMEGQDDINEHMRAVLVDWLVEVHMGFKLVPETLYLAVNIMDRYLAKAIISRKRLQLVGVTALMIAAKYEEDDPPCIKNFVYICDDTYTKPETLGMEHDILVRLNHNVTVPTAHAFLMHYLKATAHANTLIDLLSCFILEGTLLSYSMLQYKPSQLASAAIFLARRTARRSAWNTNLLKVTKYSRSEIRLVAAALLDSYIKPPTPCCCSTNHRQCAITDKYCKEKYDSDAFILMFHLFLKVELS